MSWLDPYSLMNVKPSNAAFAGATLIAGSDTTATWTASIDLSSPPPIGDNVPNDGSFNRLFGATVEAITSLKVDTATASRGAAFDSTSHVVSTSEEIATVTPQTTTDATTAKTLASFALAASKTALVDVRIVAATGVLGASYTARLRLTNNAGSLTSAIPLDTVNSSACQFIEDAIGVAQIANFVLSGGVVSVQVKGKAATTITWNAYVSLVRAN